jgi:hypothetical protein
MGDIVEKLRTLWGTYRENPVFWQRQFKYQTK